MKKFNCEGSRSSAKTAEMLTHNPPSFLLFPSNLFSRNFNGRHLHEDTYNSAIGFRVPPRYMCLEILSPNNALTGERRGNVE